jgi:hypothetical protein
MHMLQGLESSNHVVVYKCTIETDLGGSVSAISIHKTASAKSESSQRSKFFAELMEDRSLQR